MALQSETSDSVDMIIIPVIRYIELTRIKLT